MRRNYFQNAFSENLGHPPIFDCSSDKCPELLLPLLLPQLLPEPGARLASPTQSWSQSSPQHCQTTTTTEIQQQTKTKHLQASLAAQSIHQLSGRHWRNWINSFKSIHSSKKGFNSFVCGVSIIQTTQFGLSDLLELFRNKLKVEFNDKLIWILPESIILVKDSIISNLIQEDATMSKPMF